MRLLVIEPQPHQLAPLLQDWGYQVITRTCEHREVRRTLSSHDAPEVVVIDVDRLGDVGRTLARDLRSEYPWPAFCQLFVLAPGATQAVDEVLKWGGDDLVTRPVNQQMVALRLHQCQRVLELRSRLYLARGVLKFHATHDSLTAIWSKAALIGHLYREVARALRDESSLALLLCDLDHFKGFNDTHGHLVGDEVLRSVAGCIQTALRPYDIIGRYGGEEFVVLLPGCDIDEGGEVAERVRRAVVEQRFATAVGVLGTSVSVGVASLERLPDAVRSSRGPEALLEAADRALYRAKAAGRDRVAMDEPAAPAAAR